MVEVAGFAAAGAALIAASFVSPGATALCLAAFVIVAVSRG